MLKNISIYITEDNHFNFKCIFLFLLLNHFFTSTQLKFIKIYFFISFNPYILDLKYNQINYLR
jgi:hypothetical protein